MFEHGTATPISLDVTTLFIVATCVTALLGEDAQTRMHPEPGSEGRIEHLHEYAPNISFNPFVEHGDEKGAPLVWPHRSIGDQVWRGPPFNDRNELDEASSGFIAQKAVDL